MNLLTKILSVLGAVFDWLTLRSNTRRNQRREDDKYRNEVVDELRRTNDLMIEHIAKLSKEVVESRQEIVKLHSENMQLKESVRLFTEQNQQLSSQVKLLTEQNAVLIAEFEKKKTRRKAVKK
ncbi:MAG: hypothetical protein J6U04_06275 [Salinivirgaceae bacterium]|nr:hypothetical protein [Salinivirgaceae bacterium]